MEQLCVVWSAVWNTSSVRFSRPGWHSPFYHIQTFVCFVRDSICWEQRVERWEVSTRNLLRIDTAVETGGVKLPRVLTEWGHWRNTLTASHNLDCRTFGSWNLRTILELAWESSVWVLYVSIMRLSYKGQSILWHDANIAHTLRCEMGVERNIELNWFVTWSIVPCVSLALNGKLEIAGGDFDLCSAGIVWWSIVVGRDSSCCATACCCWLSFLVMREEEAMDDDEAEGVGDTDREADWETGNDEGNPLTSNRNWTLIIRMRHRRPMFNESLLDISMNDRSNSASKSSSSLISTLLSWTKSAFVPSRKHWTSV